MICVLPELSWLTWLSACLQWFAVPFWKTSRQTSADVFGLLEQQLSSTEDIRSIGVAFYNIRKLLKFNRLRLKADVSSAIITAFIFLV